MSKKERIASKAEANSRHFMKRYTHKYTAVDGRTYVAEKQPKPDEGQPRLTKQKVMVAKHGLKLNAAMMFRIELLLSALDAAHENGWEIGMKPVKTPVSNEEKEAVILKYRLEKNEDTKMFDGDPEYIMGILRSEHKSCSAFKTLKELQYAVKFGYVPVTVTKIEDGN